MQILIRKHIDSGTVIEREKWLKSLSDFGFIITDPKRIYFKEKQMLTTDMKKNWRKLFCTSLQGQIRIDNTNGSVEWRLNINSIIFKILFVWMITMSGMIFLIQIEWRSALIAGGIIPISN